METLSTLSEDVLSLILKKLDVKSAAKLIISSKNRSKKVAKYVYPRLWFNLDDIGKYKKENYIYIHKITNVTNFDHLKEFKNIRKIKFGSYFNEKVDKLPSSLTHITFGREFNQKVNNLPSSLQKITFVEYSKFNQRVDQLPTSLTHLDFDGDFN